MSVSDFPPEFFLRISQASANGYAYVCTYCGIGVDAAGSGDHAQDCGRPVREWRDDAKEVLAAITGLEREIRRPFPEFHEAFDRLVARIEFLEREE